MSNLDPVRAINHNDLVGQSNVLATALQRPHTINNDYNIIATPETRQSHSIAKVAGQINII